MPVRFDVIGNALDFLQSAADNLAAFENSSNPRDIKYGLLHLSAGIELLLKQRLAQEHWSLVFNDVDKASLAAYESANFTSVAFADSITRVRSVCGVGISSVHEKSLKGLRRLRNKVEHFSFEVSREEGLSIGARAWSFALDFMEDQLLGELNEAQTQGWEEVKVTMLGIQQFVQQRWRDIGGEIQARQQGGFLVVQCPSCLRDSLAISEDTRGCLFCRFGGELEEVFDAWMSSFHGSDWTDPKERMISEPVDHCPSCGETFFVKTPGEGGMTPPDPAFVCFRCGYSEPPTVECTECGGSFTPDDWEDYPWLCDECKTERAAGQVE